MERFDLLEQIINQSLTGNDRKAGNVINGLFGIKLSALAADFRQNINQMRLDIQQSQFKHRKQADRTCSDNQGISFDDCLVCIHSSNPFVNDI